MKFYLDSHDIFLNAERRTADGNVKLVASLCSLSLDAYDEDVSKLGEPASSMIAKLFIKKRIFRTRSHAEQLASIHTDGLADLEGVIAERSLSANLRTVERVCDGTYKSGWKLDERMFSIRDENYMGPLTAYTLAAGSKSLGRGKNMTSRARQGRQIWCLWKKISIFLLGVMAFHSGLVEALVNTEGIALLDFRFAITEDPRGIFSDWNSADPTPCTWTGVYCDVNRRVTRLVLNGAELAGTLSTSLVQLPELRTISLSGNHLTGIIPPEWAQISGLYKLNLSGNALSGSIPGQLGQILGMRLFDLSENELSGSLPAELFASCRRMRYISLANNSFAGTIPTTLGNCLAMEGIDFSHNNFQGSIPDELGKLRVLNLLNLEHNFLSGKIPAALSNCKNLTYLNLGANSLSEILPQELATLGKLEILSLHDNFFTGLVSPDVVFLPVLETVNLSSNRFSGFVPSPGARDCSLLRELDFSSNNFSGVVPQDLSKCSNLQVLNLSSNSLVSPVPPSLSSLSGIETLDLSFNALTGDIPVELTQLTRLTALLLEGNSFSGPIPAEIGRLNQLQVLDLHSMNLQGSIPDALSNLTFLSKLDLSDNQLDGGLPVFWSSLPSLEVLDLALNRLSGNIPSELSSLTKLRSLDLSNNSLDGSIPSSLGTLSGLEFLNVSYNNLSGPIPRAGILGSFNMSSFLGNPKLCGAPLNTVCQSPAPAVPPSAPRREGRTHFLSTSSIAAIAAAALIAFTMIVVTIMNVRALRKRRRNEILAYESSPPTPDVSPIVGKLVLFSKELPSRYEDWKTGTKALLDKDCMIGRGSLGIVYKVTFEGGLSIAVKKLETLGRIKNQDDFEHEMGVLGDVRHPSLVSLQGYYWSAAMQLLISDFIPNGSLFTHLHGTNGALETHLTWSVRFKIALGTARGLAYLHHDCKPPIFHFNLKVSNILLDDNFEPKVSDYGLVKLLPMLDTYISSRKFHTTLGYVAPELACQSLRLSEKCDVYSFGMVLLELVTGRQPVESFENTVIVLGEFVRSSLEQGNVRSCIDPRLDSAPDSEIMQVLKLGLICTSQTPSKRPTMAEVVQVLESMKASNNFSEAASSP
ncbi:hypothetical protein R1sor_009524 [Riccia sorocarpa]|uniref:Protein kinase domain-containing protein n=1 Tax=Riccia sorocarpa TaxID=122646 RepID=A0ABD3HVC5_9MARC